MMNVRIGVWTPALVQGRGWGPCHAFSTKAVRRICLLLFAILNSFESPGKGSASSLTPAHNLGPSAKCCPDQGCGCAANSSVRMEAYNRSEATAGGRYSLLPIPTVASVDRRPLASFFSSFSSLGAQLNMALEPFLGTRAQKAFFFTGMLTPHPIPVFGRNPQLMSSM